MARITPPDGHPHTSLKLEPYQIIRRPLVTEKGMHRSNAYNQYAFEVNPLATKLEIRTAIEDLFDVKVTKVRTQSYVGKPRRYRFKFGATKPWKKAIVTLHGDDTIQLF